MWICDRANGRQNEGRSARGNIAAVIIGEKKVGISELPYFRNKTSVFTTYIILQTLWNR